ncbi:MAG: signal peptidase I [Bacteroides sp.]|nr:signal peptidase I [Bacteroides sp.]MCM1432680.1 signal peptidase I [Clostridiales bacterium]
MQGIKVTVKMIRSVLIVLLAVILMCNLYLMAAKALTGDQPSIFGYSSAVVMSGSMSGAFEVDDMVVIHEKNDYAVGDIVTYKTGTNLVTHRIKEITQDGCYITQGDANNTTDKDPVSKDNVVGCVVTIIPKAGLIISALKSPWGMLCIVLAGGLLMCIPSGKIQEDVDYGEETKTKLHTC